ncbi:MAG TPA: hypothetical protein VKR61_17705 [Bryobacteraceae bacterium]|nr:hypothetical protein [Bryobacteraceae bacterium]
MLAAVRWETAVRAFAARTRLAMAALFLLPIVLRLALLPHAPVPVPRTPDDFSFALLGDTLAHGRMANPAHPMHRFFETNFVIQEPSYSSIYPLGQGIALAFGQMVFHQPWAGVAVCAGLFCALCYWTLRGWTSPLWALAGGLLGVFQFGPLQYWMNTYWGGSLAAAGGCLIFGSLPRLRARSRPRDAALLGLGLAVGWLTRPFETVLVALGVLLFQAVCFRGNWRGLRHTAAIAALVFLPAAALSLMQNRQVTGSWTTLPYMLAQYQYGVPASFTFQPVPTPHRALTQEQKNFYDLQASVHGGAPDSVSAFIGRLWQRVRIYRFFFSVPLFLALPAFVLALRRPRYLWVVLWLAILALGTNFYPYFYPHYIAGGACLFVLAAVTALEQVSRWSRESALLLFVVCVTQFLFWFGLHLFAGWEPALALTERYETWDYVNHGDPEGRIAIDHLLAQAPGKQLVFVRYGPQHGLSQWVANAADIDAATVVRALDLGDAENQKLLHYYPDRTAWLLEPDARPPLLSRYTPEAPAPPPRNQSPFEEVPNAPVTP